MDTWGQKHRPKEKRRTAKEREESEPRSPSSSGLLCAGHCSETRAFVVSFHFMSTKPGLSLPCFQRREVNG